MKLKFDNIKTYLPIIIMLLTALYKFYVKNVKKQETFTLTRDGTVLKEGFKNDKNEKLE